MKGGVTYFSTASITQDLGNYNYICVNVCLFSLILHGTVRVLSIGKLRWILSLRDIFFFKRLLLCAPFPISENFIFLIPRLLSLPKFLFFTFLFFFSTIFLSLQFFPITEILFHLSSRLLMWISTMAILSIHLSHSIVQKHILLFLGKYSCEWHYREGQHHTVSP